MSPFDTGDQLAEVAQMTWLLMNEYAEANGLVKTENDRLGWVITETSISKFAARAAKQVVDKDRRLDSSEKSVIRRYLRERNNVFTVGRCGPHTFDVFVAKTWSNEVAEPRAIVKHSRSTREHAEEQALKAETLAGEVVKTTLDVQVSEIQYAVLRALACLGGSVSQEFATRPIAELLGWTDDDGVVDRTMVHTMLALEEHGLITRKVHGRRTKSVALTPNGKAVLKDHINHRHYMPVVIEWLRENKSIKKGKRHRSVVLTLMEAAGIRVSEASYTGVGKAVRDLQAHRLVETTRNTDVGPYQSVTWLDKDVPEDIEQPIPLLTPTEAEPPGEAEVEEAEPKEEQVSEKKESLKSQMQRARAHMHQAHLLISRAMDELGSDESDEGIKQVLKQFSNGEVTAIKALSLIEEEVSK